MSRKYCERCGQRHGNGGLGKCTNCLEAEAHEQWEEVVEKSRALDHFMTLSVEERWELVFEHLFAFDAV